MLRAIVGVILASIVLFFVGYLFWGIMPFERWTIHDPIDETAAREALRRHFPANGAYLIPSAANDSVRGELYEEGPVAFVQMLRVEGRPALSPSIMINGFLLNSVVFALIAGILGLAARPSYWQRVQLCGAMGLAAALLINYGGVVWWEMSRPWELITEPTTSASSCSPELSWLHS